MKDQDSILLFENEYLSTAEIAETLGITSASIRNWIRHGYLHPVNKTGKVFFSKVDIEQLQKKINSGDIERLSKRANKSKAIKTFIPLEYSENKEVSGTVECIINYILESNLDINYSLFYLSLNLLQKFERAEFIADESTNTVLIRSNNPYLEKELFDWMPISTEDLDRYKKLLFFDLPNEEDILGLIYQSVLAEGSKAKTGSYYTPRKVVESIIRDYYKPNFKFLDPCCGTGRFLLAAASAELNPYNIAGIDTDPIAVRIARINLILKNYNIHFAPQVFCSDSLDDLPESFINNYDLVASNPPWGMHLNSHRLKSLRTKYPEILSGESFSLFIRRAFDLVKQGGQIVFILPEAILNVRTHKDIRKFILDHSEITSITMFGRLFKNVFTKVIRLDIKKISETQKNVDHHIKIIKNSWIYLSPQKVLASNQDYCFNFYPDELSKSIINKVYSLNYKTLKNNAEWALGIVTGDNKKFVSSIKTEGYENVFTGKEISRFRLKEACRFIKYVPEAFQQSAPTERYRAKEKLVYKFISNSLVVAYDDKQSLTLNSANILIPNVHYYPIKTILALFNSSVYQFIFKSKFNSIKVLRSHLEVLPLPILDEETHVQIREMVNLIIKGGDQIEQLDNYIFNLFKLNKEETEYIKNYS